MRRFEVVKEGAILPTRATEYSAGYDIAACLGEGAQIILNPNRPTLVPTGLTVRLFNNEWAGLYIRSSIAKKFSIILLNSVGVVDKDFYPNEFKFMLLNLGDKPVAIKHGDRIGQVIIQPYLKTIDDNGGDSKRDGGFGSTGK